MPVTTVNEWWFKPGGDIQEGMAAADEYVRYLNQHSPNVQLSQWLRDRRDPRHFFHIIVFKNYTSLRNERESQGTARFIERLFPHIIQDETFTAPECDVVLCNGGTPDAISLDPHALEDFSMRLNFKVPADKLFKAVADEGHKWWSQFAEIDSSIGGICSFKFPKAGFFATFRVTEKEPGRFIEWHCLDSRHPVETGYVDLKDWIDTSIRFEIEPVDNDRSTLHFRHIGLQPNLECFDTCKSTWSMYLNESLRGYLETGQGKTYKDDSENNL